MAELRLDVLGMGALRDEQAGVRVAQVVEAGLPRDQAGVAWMHYRLRRAGLEAALSLGAPARALVSEIEEAPAGALGALGARLYRLQHGGAVTLTAVEWRRIWQAYHTRRPRAA